MDVFTPEINILEQAKSLKGSRLYNLNPFIDNDGVLRVGGRI